MRTRGPQVDPWRQFPISEFEANQPQARLSASFAEQRGGSPLRIPLPRAATENSRMDPEGSVHDVD